MVFELYKGRDPKSNRKVWLFFIVPYIALLLWVFFSEFNGSFSAVFKEDAAMAVLAIVFPIVMTLLAFWDRRYSQGKFIVADDGIAFQTEHVDHFMPWENLSHVVIRKHLVHFYSNLVVVRMGQNITTYPMNYTPKIFMGDDGKLKIIKENLGILSPKSTSSYYMYAKHSEELISEVKKHFKKDITNEYSLYMKGVAKWL